MKTLKTIILVTGILLFSVDGFAQNKLTKWLNKRVEWWRDLGRSKKWGKYKPDYYITQQHPYTLFIRKNEVSIDDLKEFIDTEVIPNIEIDFGDFKYHHDAYKELLQDGASVKQPAGFPSEGVSPAASAAKNAAFVYLIGMNINGAGAVEDLGSIDRNAYKDRALTMLKNLNPQVQTIVGATPAELIALGSMTIPPKWSILYGLPSLYQKYERNANRAAELIMYLEAYDMLKTAVKLGSLKYHNNPSSSFTFNVSQGDLDEIKDKLQLFARNLILKADGLFGPFSKKNNHSIRIASALGMAAVILNDEGYWKFQPNWHPKRWGEWAHANIQRSLWNSGLNAPMSNNNNPNFSAGYAEGPHYFDFAFEYAVPFFRTFDNYVQNGDGENITYENTYKVANYNMKNYIGTDIDPAYYNLFEWYHNILQPGGSAPTYDNTFTHKTYSMFWASIGKQEFFTFKPEYNGTSIDLRADLVASGLFHNPSNKPEADYFNEESGDIILRTNTPNQNGDEAHYFRLNVKKGTAVKGGNHEHRDAGSFILGVGDPTLKNANGEGYEALALDPAYIGYDFRKHINRGHHHNLITLNRSALFNWDFLELNDEAGPTRQTTSEVKFLVPQPSETVIKIFTEYQSSDFDREVTREVEGDNVIYVINDKAEHSFGFNKDFHWQLHGNGNSITGATQPPGTGYLSTPKEIAIWKYPCSQGRNWQLAALVAVEGGNDGIVVETDQISSKASASIHGTQKQGYICTRQTINHINQNIEGFHSTLIVDKNSSGSAKFLSVLIPFKCNESTPDMTKTEEPGRTFIVVKDLLNGTDTIDMVFLSASNGKDSITNPFTYSGSTDVLLHNAQTASLKVSRDSLKYFKNCEAVTKFRKAKIGEGTVLTYASDTLIKAPDAITAGYELSGKYRYHAYVHNTTGGDIDVTFYLPDLAVTNGVDMVAGKSKEEGSYTSTFNDTTNRITITVPNGTSQFEIRPADDCLVSCFFPPTNITIDSLFDFNTGTKEKLGHDLDIVTSNGHLKVTEGSKVDICSDYTLANKDSITMLGKFDRKTDVDFPYYTEYGEDGQAVATGDVKVMDRVFSKKSMIIVNERAALVLESGSYTHVGANSTILVRKGGTLYIETGAYLEIGSPDYPGWAEIILEDSAFLCVEYGANIEFHDNPNDSTDKNVFYVSMTPTKPTLADANPIGAMGKFAAPSGIYSGHSCLAICNIETQNLFSSIANPPFGWSNINTPHATLEMEDTFCYNTDVYANCEKTLNESEFHLQVEEYDSATQTFKYTQTYIPSTVPTKWDSIRVKQINVSDYFTFSAQKSYLIKLITRNDCGKTDTAEKIIYIESLPVASFTLADSACPGAGTVIANGSGSANAVTHIWNVVEKVDEDILLEDYGSLPTEEDFEVTGSVSSSYSFPGLKFEGNKNYEISLEVRNGCGTDEVVDSIKIPLGVSINADPEILYSAGSVDLTGTTYGASSFQWTSDGSLNDNTSLTHTETLSSTTKYWLAVADGGSCHDTDSVIIKVNIYANASKDTIICKGDSIQIGTSGQTLPPGYTYEWSPGGTLSDSTINQPYATPTEHIIYTLNVRDGSNNIVESDDVFVFLDTMAVADFITKQDSAYYFCFQNVSTPSYSTNSYTWEFGDGSSDKYTPNVCHVFPVLQKDTFYYVCLTVSNACGDSTFCDTVILDSTGFLSLDKTILSNVGIESSEPSISMYAIPNPASESVTFRYSIPANAENSYIEVRDVWGREVGHISLDTHKKSKQISLINYSKGVYLYSLIINNQVIQTEKLIVE